MAAVEKNFLRFLIEASPQQAKVLLRLITPRQLTGLSETCFNLTHADVDPTIINDLKKHRGLIRQLADKKISAKHRAKLAAKHYKKITDILQIAEPVLP